MPSTVDRWGLHAELAVGGEVPAQTIAAAVNALKALGAAHYAEGILAIRIDAQASSAEEARARAIGRFYEALERVVGWTHVRLKTDGGQAGRSHRPALQRRDPPI